MAKIDKPENNSTNEELTILSSALKIASPETLIKTKETTQGALTLLLNNVKTESIKSALSKKDNLPTKDTEKLAQVYKEQKTESLAAVEGSSSQEIFAKIIKEVERRSGFNTSQFPDEQYS